MCGVGVLSTLSGQEQMATGGWQGLVIGRQAKGWEGAERPKWLGAFPGKDRTQGAHLQRRRKGRNRVQEGDPGREKEKTGEVMSASLRPLSGDWGQREETAGMMGQWAEDSQGGCGPLPPHMKPAFPA